MKKVVLFLLLSVCSTLVQAQANFYEDVITLVNGSKIRGRIVEEVPNQTITIAVMDGSTYVYKLEEVSGKSKEPIKNRPVYLLDKGQRPGFHLMIDQGTDVGEISELFRSRLNVIAKYQFNPYFSMGPGLGFRYFPSEAVLLIPFFADFRVNFTNSSISPYYAFQLGYSFGGYQWDFESVGAMAGSAVGTSFRISEKIVLHLGLGYEMQLLGLSDIGTSAISIQSGITF